MTIEGLLVQKLSTITELNHHIYPLYVPECIKAPYIAYVGSGGEHSKDLDGFNDFEQCKYEINILCNQYIELKSLEKQVYNVLKDLIGEHVDNVVIQDVNLSSPIEQYEEAINLVRANIEVTIYL